MIAAMKDPDLNNMALFVEVVKAMGFRGGLAQTQRLRRIETMADELETSPLPPRR